MDADNQERMIVLGLPEEKVITAFGRIAILHCHLDHVLRMTIKTLAGVTPHEAMSATEQEGSSELRKRIRVLAKQKLGEGTTLIRLQALIERSRIVTQERNTLVHNICAQEIDGEYVMKNDKHEMVAMPSIAVLERLGDDIQSLVHEFNEARLMGFLAVALSQSPKYVRAS
jgi:hypothetical protein